MQSGEKLKECKANSRKLSEVAKICRNNFLFLHLARVISQLRQHCAYEQPRSMNNQEVSMILSGLWEMFQIATPWVCKSSTETKTRQAGAGTLGANYSETLHTT
jgi:hypothetical protein